MHSCCVRGNGPCARPKGYCSSSLVAQFSFSWQAGGPSFARVVPFVGGFNRRRMALPHNALECSMRPTTGQGFTRYQRTDQLAYYGNSEVGMFCCFTHEGACTQIWDLGPDSGPDSGLIWLRHARARMGHQVVASPTVRYILRGERNRSVAVNSLSLIEIWETCTLLLKHPPTSRARTPLARGRANEGGRPERLCHPVGGRAAALRAQNWQQADEQAATSQP